MDTRKGIFECGGFRMALCLTRLQILPSHQPHILVEQQLARRITVAHQKLGHGIVTRPGIIESPDVQIGQDIHVVRNERLGTSLEKCSGMKQSPSGIQQGIRLEKPDNVQLTCLYPVATDTNFFPTANEIQFRKPFPVQPRT